MCFNWRAAIIMGLVFCIGTIPAKLIGKDRAGGADAIKVKPVNPVDGAAVWQICCYLTGQIAGRQEKDGRIANDKPNILSGDATGVGFFFLTQLHVSPQYKEQADGAIRHIGGLGKSQDIVDAAHTISGVAVDRMKFCAGKNKEVINSLLGRVCGYVKKIKVNGEIPDKDCLILIRAFNGWGVCSELKSNEGDSLKKALQRFGKYKTSCTNRVKRLLREKREDYQTLKKLVRQLILLHLIKAENMPKYQDKLLSMVIRHNVEIVRDPVFNDLTNYLLLASSQDMRWTLWYRGYLKVRQGSLIAKYKVSRKQPKKMKAPSSFENAVFDLLEAYFLHNMFSLYKWDIDHLDKETPRNYAANMAVDKRLETRITASFMKKSLREACVELSKSGVVVECSDQVEKIPVKLTIEKVMLKDVLSWISIASDLRIWHLPDGSIYLDRDH